jgi:hypothetical protein
METIAYTIGGSTTEVPLNTLGAGPHLKINFGTHGESKCTLDLATLPPEIAPAIPFEAPCVLHTGRSGSGGSWSGGSILFQGRRTDNNGQASAEGANQQLVIEDAWYDLRFITLQAAWPNITGYSGTTPTYGTPFTWPDCVLFQSTNAGQLKPNGTFGAYSPAPLYGHITTGQAIEEILAYAIYFGGVNLQVGQIDPACYVPFYPVRSMRCADALITCLRVHPDCACEIDYTVTPPKFNIRQRTNLTGVTLPYKSSSFSSSSSKQTHLSSKPRPRPDLIPSRVGLYLKETTTINGNPVVSVSTDIYPPSLPSGLRSLDASLDMTGPKLAKTNATLTTAEFDPTNLAWWAQKIPALRSQADQGQIPNTGFPGALTLINSAINGGAKSIQVLDNSQPPVPIDLALYPYELVTGTPAGWMQLGSGAAVTVIEANVTAFFSYNKVTAAGAANITDQIGEHLHSVRLKLTNSPAPGATYQLSQVLNTGESYPGGLAQSIYTSLATLQYNFSHTILESPFATVIKPGKHCLNLNGGSAAWTAMNAMVQEVELDLMFTPGSNVTTAKTTVNCGPVQHLEAGELVQLFNLFTNRDLSKINPNERSSGASLGGGDVTLGSDSPKENSSPAQSLPVETNNVVVSSGAVTGQTIQSAAIVAGIVSGKTPISGGSAGGMMTMQPRELAVCDNAGNVYYAAVQATQGHTTA